MAFVEWNDSYVINIPAIDRQHARLFEHLDDFYQSLRAEGRDAAPAIAQLVQRLENYATYHFRSEEDLMRRHGFRGLDAHRREHDSFSAKLSAFRERMDDGRMVLSVELTNYLRDWIGNHISRVDRLMAFELSRTARGSSG